jgi:hypothetical protein
MANAAYALTKTTRSAEYLRNPSWENATGTTPLRWLMWGHNKIMVVPSKIGEFQTGENFKIGYVEMPALISASTDTPDIRIPIKDQEYLKYAAAFYLLSMRTDKQFTDMAEYFMDKFHKLIGA